MVEQCSYLWKTRKSPKRKTYEAKKIRTKATKIPFACQNSQEGAKTAEMRFNLAIMSHYRPFCLVSNTLKSIPRYSAAPNMIERMMATWRIYNA
jgi:hypothetical protein